MQVWYITWYANTSAGIRTGGASGDGADGEELKYVWVVCKDEVEYRTVV